MTGTCPRCGNRRWTRAGDYTVRTVGKSDEKSAVIWKCVACGRLVCVTQVPK